MLLLLVPLALFVVACLVIRIWSGQPAATRVPDWKLETPTTPSELFRQNPYGSLFMGFVVTAIVVAVSSDLLDIHPGMCVPLGLGAWWLLMFAFAKGWVEDE